jgi:chemotaxis protein CheX
MNLHDLLVSCISHASANVFTTMLGVEIRQGEVSVESGSPDPNDGVVSLIGLAGTWTGAGSITCSPALACRICSQLLMTDSPSVNEDVLDAVAELTNMIIGSVKTDLEQHLGPLGLSIPTVVFGRNFKTRTMATSDWTVVRVYWDDECLLVKLCLARNERMPLPPAVTHAGIQTCTLDV